MIYIIITIALFVTELVIKNYIEKHKKEMEECIIKDELYINYTKNKGAFYSLLSDKPGLVCGISSFLLGIMGIIYGVLLSKKGNIVTKLGMSLVMAGGLSNVYDRIKRKYVVDYIYLKRLKKIIFNLADVFIVIGSIVVCIGEMFRE